MNKTIQDISQLLAASAFKDEQHVRFSLVGRICQSLGWSIGNPKEFYTEYPVKRYPPQEVTTELRGRVDVALMLSEKRSEIAGFEPCKDLQIGYDESERKRNCQ